MLFYVSARPIFVAATGGQCEKPFSGRRTPLILDVRPKEIRQQEGSIPGAVPARPEDIEKLAMTYSRDLEIVVYCACPNEASAAIAAQHLKRAGFKKIRPLLGGIDAWAQAGQPLERAPSTAAPPLKAQ